MKDRPETLFEVSSAARRLGVSPTTLRRWEREGRLSPSFRLEHTGTRAFRESDLAELITRIHKPSTEHDQSGPATAA